MQRLKQWVAGQIVLLLSLAITACQPETGRPEAAQPQVVNAHHYNRFWLWGNISPAPYLRNNIHKPNSTDWHSTTELYVLQGEIGFSRILQKPGLTPQGMGLTTIKPAKIWLVYRTTTLQWTPAFMQQIVGRLQSWKNYNNQVVGLQIDFDSATGQLKPYTEFLQRIRQQLPTDYQLSATGLLDWINADKTSLASLHNTVDEVVIQTYQGRHTITNYQAYLPALSHLKMPFKIGLVQHGQWLANSAIEKNPYFKGYVVFLLRQ
ncbi:hypothetical protein BKE30_08435 [Alkanindiges hydrocarboniclasticus]|uniref:DUF3142 domain-containing protein n=1 Tax=Alkanindiges hydrocarboniclasticus TaxID=1907941 RepID=A0A1S8CTQ0_9GAMM|nr:DUF3142 domain-containing protein [Alkanindiges hydrocarboniclasticus]ONG39800.1 hypothetical protein BKE30_08435 [Alkanindiges hydrocarboniclasticus]